MPGYSFRSTFVQKKRPVTDHISCCDYLLHLYSHSLWDKEGKMSNAHLCPFKLQLTQVRHTLEVSKMNVW